MTAKGKINASNVTTGDRIIVKARFDAEGHETISESATKTGEGVFVARVIGKDFRAAGRYEARGKYIVHTTAGSFEAAPIQTMWLAPEDAAGVKRAYAEAVAEDAHRAELAATVEIEEAAPATPAPTPAELVESMDEIHEATTDRCSNDWHRTAPARRRMLCPECPPLAAGRELVRLADIAPSNLLTLDSHAGKVGLNSKADTEEPEMTATTTTENDTQTETPAEVHTGSTVVILIEKVWDAIRAEHPELPRVVVTTGSGEGVKWGHFRPESWRLGKDGEKLHEFFLASEALAKGATQVLQTTIHEAAHTLSKVRGVQDTSRQNRYHNGTFRKTAEELGLEHKGASPDKTHGFSFVTLTPATKVKYADILAELERELKLTGLLPFWLGGTDDEDERGGEKITGKPVKGQEGETKSGNLKATCSCEEPIIIRLSRKVLDLGVVRCDSCAELFTAA